MIVCDTSGLLACLDDRQRAHASCVAAVRADQGPLILSAFVLAELDYLIAQRVGYETAVRLLEEVAAGAYLLGNLDSGDLSRVCMLSRRYQDLQLGLADASLVVLAERHRTRRLLTLDQRHFRAVEPLQGGAFELLPLDA